MSGYAEYIFSIGTLNSRGVTEMWHFQADTKQVGLYTLIKNNKMSVITVTVFSY